MVVQNHKQKINISLSINIILDLTSTAGRVEMEIRILLDTTRDTTIVLRMVSTYWYFIVPMRTNMHYTFLYIYSGSC